MKQLIIGISTLALLFLSGCATVQPYDYTAFKESKPRSILVLPPVNDTHDVNAPIGVLSQVTYPLAESGYYVFPVAATFEIFKQNGLTSGTEAQATSIKKLHDIFGADSALYLQITNYGTQYQVFNSETRVTVNAKLVDLRNGKKLWEGSATASSSEKESNSSGFISKLINALIKQIADTSNDASHRIAATTSDRLLSAGKQNAILFGPRSPLYGQDPSNKK